MSLKYHTTEKHPVVSSLLTDRGLDSAAVNLNISAADEMYLLDLQYHKQDRDAALAVYFLAGLQIRDLLAHVLAWKFGGPRDVPSLLEFACGYGRSTRFVVSDVPPDRVWASDIYPAAVRFQQEQFGVHGFVSTHRPEDFRCDRTFACIFVGSLFSHLPQATFTPWLHRLFGLLAPGGILVFSAHDAVLLPPGLVMPGAGFYFVEGSESRTLSGTDYGGMWVTEGFAARAIAEASNHRATYRRIKWGYCQRQDVYVVSQEAGEDFSALGSDLGPRGYVDCCTGAGEGTFTLAGWAAPLTSGTVVTRVYALINGHLAGECMPAGERPDVAQLYDDEGARFSGWQCHCLLPGRAVLPNDILLVKAETSGGGSNVLYAGRLVSALAGGAQPVTPWLFRWRGRLSAGATAAMRLARSPWRNP